MICRRCEEEKEDSEFLGRSRMCRDCMKIQRKINKELPLADNELFAYGHVLTFDVNWKPNKLADETVLAIVRDMRADMGLLRLVDKYSLPRSVIVDICGGKAYADVTGIKLSEAKVWRRKSE